MDLTSIEYPYYNLYKTRKEILEDFEKFKNYKSNKKLNRYKLYFIRLDYNKDEKYLRLTDWFSEECRVKCVFLDNESAFDYYKKNKAIINNKFKDSNYIDIDKYLWKNTRQCSNFPIPIALIMLRTFKCKRWLDPSAGWGDRLIAAIAYNCEYQGIDPSPCMHKKYDGIIETLANKKDRKKFNVKKIGFENYKVKENYYDLVFTSPPFFALEKYVNDPSQSYVKFYNKKLWVRKFLYPLIDKSLLALTAGGHLALYISDYKNIIYVDKMKKYISSKNQFKWRGEMQWKIGKETRKIYIWKKIEN